MTLGVLTTHKYLLRKCPPPNIDSYHIIPTNPELVSQPPVLISLQVGWLRLTVPTCILLWSYQYDTGT